MKAVYHLDLDEKMIKEAKIALLPGDPDKVGIQALRILTKELH